MAATDELDALYEVAEDWEAAVIDELRRRAGLVWDCYGADGESVCWTNDRMATACEHCGRSRTTADGSAELEVSGTRSSG